MPVIAIMLVFCLGLLLGQYFALDARVLMCAALLTGLFVAFYLRRDALKASYAALSMEALKFKCLAVYSALVAMVLTSTLLGLVFSTWPSAAFNYEFLLTLPLLFLLTPIYLRWAGRRLPEVEDEYYRFGQALLGQREWYWQEQRLFVLAWLVKIFFIPLMYSFTTTAVAQMLVFDWRLHPSVWVLGLFSFGICIDVLVGTAGYLFAFRSLNLEIKSVDRSWWGWAVCLICYPPLLEVFRAIRQQVDEEQWDTWLSADQPLYWLWAFMITASWVVYWVSTVSFGLRFSNLSWRGLVDCGPYRWTKHPAYLSKNIYWWLHTVPFVGVTVGADMLRNVLGLSFVSLVYYWRAKTEEAHLRQFSEYAAYEQRIEQQGLMARLLRAIGLRKAANA